jgi:hypothetical protein
MIRVSVKDPAFYQAWLRATRALGGVERLETPRQYGARWREAYRCRVDANSGPNETYYIFDHDEDYTWFMLRWA